MKVRDSFRRLGISSMGGAIGVTLGVVMGWGIALMLVGSEEITDANDVFSRTLDTVLTAVTVIGVFVGVTVGGVVGGVVGSAAGYVIARRGPVGEIPSDAPDTTKHNYVDVETTDLPAPKLSELKPRGAS